MNRPAVLVTGAAKRIGAAIAQKFGQAGWHVVIHYRQSAKEAETIAAKLPSAEIVDCDLTNPSAAKQMMEELATRLRDWRVLVNNASIFQPDRADSFDLTTNTQSMRTNAQAPVVLTQSFLRHAQAKQGRRVIQITDQKLANPNPDFFSYTMSKHALGATIPMMAMAQADPSDRIYGLAPGAILASHDQTPEEADRSHRLNLLNRRTEADEVADAAFFLAQGWLESGETLFVDSGQHLLDQARDVIYLARNEAES